MKKRVQKNKKEKKTYSEIAQKERNGEHKLRRSKRNDFGKEK